MRTVLAHRPLSQGSLIILFSILIPVLVFVLSNAILREDMAELTLVGALATGAISTFFILGDWRIGVTQFFVWIVFEDLVRKFLGNSMLVYGVKDLLILTTYFSFLLCVWRRREIVLENPIRVPLSLFVAWVVVCSFGLGIDTPFVPVLGMRMSLFYVPMLYLGYAFLQDEVRLRRFLLMMTCLAGLISVIGIIQVSTGLNFLNPPEATGLRLYLTRYSPESVMMVPRPTSTFVDAGRFAQYVFFLAYVGLGFLGYLYSTTPTRSFFSRWRTVLLWTTVVAALLLSGQRTAIVLFVLSAPVVAILHFRERARRRLGMGRFPLAKVVIIGTLALSCLVAVLPERFVAVRNFVTESLQPGGHDPQLVRRPAATWQDIGFAFQQSGFSGHGTGTASLGLLYLQPYLTEAQMVRYAPQVEGGYAAVLWEWGIVGLVLWCWWTVALVWAMFRAVSQVRGSRFFWLALSIAICVTLVLFPYFSLGMQVYQNYLTQALLWFMVGLVFRFPSLLASPAPVLRTPR